MQSSWCRGGRRTRRRRAKAVIVSQPGLGVVRTAGAGRDSPILALTRQFEQRMGAGLYRTDAALPMALARTLRSNQAPLRLAGRPLGLRPGLRRRARPTVQSAAAGTAFWN